MGLNRRVKYLPDTLADKFKDAVEDGELLNLRIDLGLLEIRFEQLMKKIETSDPESKWREFGEIAVEINKAVADQEFTRVAMLSKTMTRIITDKLSDYAVWKEIGELIEQRRKLTESESNRLVRMNEMITAEDMTKLMQRLMDAIKRYVKDPNIYAAIANEFAIASGAAPVREPDGGDQEVQPERSGEVDQGELLGSRTQGSDPVS